ncbi:hypothetical protein [Nocardia alni]|uniref:hypothetical protein n=1 Tax=Nocardia alni TaxID=2815723 RepID=UPI001C24B3C0|nr:hypothetical protein [Nocardia alni]
MPANPTITPTDSNLSDADAAVFLADHCTVLQDGHDKLALVAESQTAPPTEEKRRALPAYVAIAQRHHRCGAVLMMLARNRRTAQACRRPIHTGHPNFVLEPIAIGPDETPDPNDPAHAKVAAELTVLAAFTGALNLDRPAAREEVLHRFAALDPDRRFTYTGLVKALASEAARTHMEEMMAFEFKDPFFEKIKTEAHAEGLTEGRAEGRTEGLTEGRTEGEARILLRMLAARGFSISKEVRRRVESCTDTNQLERWADRTVNATSLDAVFGA